MICFSISMAKRKRDITMCIRVFITYIYTDKCSSSHNCVSKSIIGCGLIAHVYLIVMEYTTCDIIRLVRLSEQLYFPYFIVFFFFFLNHVVYLSILFYLQKMQYKHGLKFFFWCYDRMLIFVIDFFKCLIFIWPQYFKC